MLGVVVQRTKVLLQLQKIYPRNTSMRPMENGRARFCTRVSLRGSPRACAKARMRRCGEERARDTGGISDTRPLSLCSVGFLPETVGPFPVSQRSGLSLLLARR